MANGDRKRRKWGCRRRCKDADGRHLLLAGPIPSPVNPRQRIYRRFGLEFQAEAYRWLDEEHALVIDHKKGIRKWTHPSARTMYGKVLFASYATTYVSNLRKKGGSELSGRSKRIQKAALDKLLPWFGRLPCATSRRNSSMNGTRGRATRCVPPRLSTRSGCSSA